MAMTGLDTFDTSVQKSEGWIKEIMEGLGWDSRHRAYGALRVVLQALRDQLTVEESADLSAQLPLVIRGVYYDRWKPSAVPSRDRRLDDFLVRIKEELGSEGEDVEPERIARVVLNVLKKHVTEGEIEDVESILPSQLASLI